MAGCVVEGFVMASSMNTKESINHTPGCARREAAAPSRAEGMASSVASSYEGIKQSHNPITQHEGRHNPPSHKGRCTAGSGAGKNNCPHKK